MSAPFKLPFKLAAVLKYVQSYTGAKGHTLEDLTVMVGDDTQSDEQVDLTQAIARAFDSGRGPYYAHASKGGIVTVMFMSVTDNGNSGSSFPVGFHLHQMAQHVLEGGDWKDIIEGAAEHARGHEDDLSSILERLKSGEHIDGIEHIHIDLDDGPTGGVQA